MERESLDRDFEARAAEEYWLGFAERLTELRDSPHGSPEYVAAYRLYVLSVLAVVEQDTALQTPAAKATMLNLYFHQGLIHAAQTAGRDERTVSRFYGQDLTAHQWDDIIAHDIGPNLRLKRGMPRDTPMPETYLEVLQVIEAGRLAILLPEPPQT